jgi:hypothetical protein
VAGVVSSLNESCTCLHASLLGCRHTLRKGDGGSKVAGLLSFPDEEGGSGQGQEGMVVWAADNSISMTLPSSKVSDIAL